jgi:purine nucleosidase
MARKPGNKAAAGRLPLVIIHSGAIDEFIATLLAISADSLDLRAVIVVDADCFGVPALEIAHKIGALTKSPAKIGLSAARALNAFPWNYRTDCVRQGRIPSFNNLVAPPFNSRAGEAILASVLDDATSPVTIVITSPMTPLQLVLEDEPKRAAKIDRIIWMGGAIDVAGNLDVSTVPAPMWNAYAEWNAFWDPDAVARVFAMTKCRLTIVPLDLTNRAPVAKELIAMLAKQARTSRFSAVAFESYQLITNEPFYEMWDVVTVAVLTRPDLFEPAVDMHITVDPAYTPTAGALRRDPSGRKVDVFLAFARQDPAPFYRYVASQLDR